MDNGPHACDLIRRFLGEVVAGQGVPSARTPDLPAGCETEAYALFRDHDQGVAELRSSWTSRSGYLTVEVRGSEGWLRVETAPWRLTGVLADGRRVDRRYLAERVAERRLPRPVRLRAVARPRARGVRLDPAGASPGSRRPAGTAAGSPR